MMLGERGEQLERQEQKTKMLAGSPDHGASGLCQGHGKCRFKVQDVVTPRGVSAIRGAGSPFVVVEVAETPIRVLSSNDARDTMSNAFGAILDMRVICRRAPCPRFRAGRCTGQLWAGPISIRSTTAAFSATLAMNSTVQMSRWR